MAIKIIMENVPDDFENVGEFELGFRYTQPLGDEWFTSYYIINDIPFIYLIKKESPKIHKYVFTRKKTESWPDTVVKEKGQKALDEYKKRQVAKTIGRLLGREKKVTK